MQVTRIRSLTAALCGLLVILMVSPVFAQGPQGGQRGMRGPMGGGMMRGGMGMIRLLGVEQVQKELQMTDEQKADVQKLAEAQREEFRKVMDEVRDMSQEERQQWFQENHEKFQQQAAQRVKETEEKLAGMLSAEQLKRVKQIQMQQMGVMVLRQSEVMEALALTDDQKEQLKKIEEEIRGQMRRAFESGRPDGPEGEGDRGDRQQRRQRMQTMREEIQKKAMAVLTPEQKKTLAELMGEPFELDRSAFRGPRGQRGESRRGRRQREGDPQGESI